MEGEMMAGLKISRRPGQTVLIETPGFGLLMEVEAVSRGNVKLSFLGPKDVRISRGEFFAAVRGFDVYDRLVFEGKRETANGGDSERELPGQRKLWEGTDAVETTDR